MRVHRNAKQAIVIAHGATRAASEGRRGPAASAGEASARAGSDTGLLQFGPGAGRRLRVPRPGARAREAGSACPRREQRRRRAPRRRAPSCGGCGPTVPAPTRAARRDVTGIALAPAVGARPRHRGVSMAQPTNPTDAELDAFIAFRLGMLGIDLSVLPYDDPSAPVDHVRAYAAMRSTLRSQIQLLEFPL